MLAYGNMENGLSQQGKKNTCSIKEVYEIMLISGARGIWDKVV